jgi:hypothetical protein
MNSSFIFIEMNQQRLPPIKYISLVPNLSQYYIKTNVNQQYANISVLNKQRELTRLKHLNNVKDEYIKSALRLNKKHEFDIEYRVNYLNSAEPRPIRNLYRNIYNDVRVHQS